LDSDYQMGPLAATGSARMAYGTDRQNRVHLGENPSRSKAAWAS